MRNFLDRLYSVSLGFAAFSLLVIAALVSVQIAGRIADAAMGLVGLAPYNLTILSLSEIAGYLLAGASFLALAGTLKAGIHVRMTMVIDNLGTTARRIVDLAGLALGAVFSGYMTWHVAQLVRDSWTFGEVSGGVVAVQLAYPQAVVAIGLLILTVAFIDELVITILHGNPSFTAIEQRVSVADGT
jgi:TRAP-type mannitol/chloroaromatic compound transport system permease small subunit